VGHTKGKGRNPKTGTHRLLILDRSLLLVVTLLLVEASPVKPAVGGHDGGVISIQFVDRSQMYARKIVFRFPFHTTRRSTYHKEDKKAATWKQPNGK
jgi:hypothetical protein